MSEIQRDQSAYLPVGDCLLLCDSTHQLLKAESLLETGGVLFETIPRPRQFSGHCGMALRFAQELLPQVKEILEPTTETWACVVMLVQEKTFLEVWKVG